MSKFIKLSALSLSGVLLAALVGPAQAEVSDAGHFSNQTPYGDPATSPVLPAPAGYSMLFIETVGRHGSRALTDPGAETRALKVWKAAKKKKKLTKIGKQFAADVAAFQAAERSIGYGNLSNVGYAEWAGIGRRTAANYEPFLQGAKVAGDAIAFVNSGVYRTKQSADAMKARINDKVPSLNYVESKDARLLLLSSGSTADGRKAIAKLKKTKRVKAAAKHVLGRLYTKGYVNKLKDPVGKAMDIYLLYCTAPGMAGNTNVNFASYVPVADAQILGLFKDGENFYRYGPGVAGQSNSYIRAAGLLTDFFGQLDARVHGGKNAAIFRLAHGETTMPFAAMIKAPGSQVQMPRGQTLNFANPWRGYVAGRLAGNIEWVAYKKAASVLVTMRYNEQPVDFKAGCIPAAGEPHFYELSELKRCLL